MGRYGGKPHELSILGVERVVTTRRLGPGVLRIGRRRFWADEVEVVVSYALPTVWEPPRPARPHRPPAAPPAGTPVP